MIAIIVLVAVWAICGFLTYCISFAHFQKEFAWLKSDSRREDAGHALFLSLLGPLSLVIIFLFTGFAKHGFMLWSKFEPNEDNSKKTNKA